MGCDGQMLKPKAVGGKNGLKQSVFSAEDSTYFFEKPLQV